MNQLLITCLFIISWWHSKCSPQMLKDRPLLIAKSLSIPHIWHLHELITFLLRPFPESFSMSSSTYTNVSFRVVYRCSQSPHASFNAESTVLCTENLCSYCTKLFSNWLHMSLLHQMILYVWRKTWRQNIASKLLYLQVLHYHIWPS